MCREAAASISWHIFSARGINTSFMFPATCGVFSERKGDVKLKRIVWAASSASLASPYFPSYV